MIGYTWQSFCHFNKDSAELKYIFNGQRRVHKRCQFTTRYRFFLTLKAPRKTASEKVVCLCRLLNILANFSNIFLHTANSVDPDQTAPKGAVWSGSKLFAKMTFKITSRWQSRRQLLWLAVLGLSKWMHLADLPPFYKGDNFRDFCLLTWTQTPFCKCAYSKKKEREQMLSF